MATHFFLRRGGTLAVAIAMSLISLSAQTTTMTHVIDRGETIETIAEKYGVTPQSIIDLNPAAAQFVYVGMELTIPYATDAQTPNVQVVSHEGTGAAVQGVHERAQNDVEYNVPSSSASTSGVVSGVAEEVTPYSFCHYGAAYHTSFEHFDMGTYGVAGSVYSPGGWGGNLFLGGSWGLTDPAVFTFEVGPSYCYAFSPNVALATDLNFCGSFMYLEEPVVKTSNGFKIGNHYYPPEEYMSTETKTHFGWGILLQPTLVFKFGGFMPMAGLRIWGQDEKDINGKSKFKFHVGLALGICFNV